MLKSNAPTKYTVPFATSGTRNSIPVTSSPTPGLASYTTGFPSVTMEPIASGGVPPEGQDFNGIFYDATKASLWQQMGFVSAYDNTFATNSNVGGYAAQSLVCRADGKGLWLSTADNNTSNPDTTGATGWMAIRGNAGSTTIATTGGVTTPDASVLGAPLLIISGALASNASIILPLSGGASWIVENNTTGSFTLTIQGSTGTGAQVAQGSPSQVYTDGTNFYATTANVSGLYLPINGNAVSASKLANARTIAMTGDVAWSVSFDGSANVTATGAIQAASVTLAKMANFNANSLMGNPTSSAATPQAITLANGLQFSGTTLGMGAITPTSVTSSGMIFADYTGSTPGSTGGVAIGDPTGSSSARVTITAGGQPTSYASLDANGEELRIFGAYRGAAANVYATCSFQTPSWTFVYPVSVITAASNAGVSVSTTGSNGIGVIVTDTSNVAGIQFRAGNGSTSPNKTWRANGSNGRLELVNSAYTSIITNIDDSGNISCANVACNTLTATAASSITTNGSTGSLTITDTNANGANFRLVGNGSTTPSKTIRAIGGQLQIVNSAYSAGIFTLTDAGALSTAGTIQPGSDARVKDDVRKIENALAVVRKAFVGVTYNRNDQGGKHEAGFVADSVLAELPFMGDTHAELNGLKNFKTLNYNGAEAYLANAITELHDVVLDLQQRVAGGEH